MKVRRPIEDAIAELTEALDELDDLMPTDRTTVGVVAHAMNRYLSVSEAVLNLMAEALRDHPHPAVARWLDGLRRIDGMMEHAVRRLVYASPADDLLLQPEPVDLAVLMERACDHHRPRMRRAQVDIVCRAVGVLPPVWADAVAVAVIADALLSNAAGSSEPGTAILVQVVPGPGGVVCSIRATCREADLRESPEPPARTAPPPMAAPADAHSTDFAIQTATAFAERMGGRLWVERIGGRGSVVSFRLPYHPPDAAHRT